MCGFLLIRWSWLRSFFVGGQVWNQTKTLELTYVYFFISDFSYNAEKNKISVHWPLPKFKPNFQIGKL